MRYRAFKPVSVDGLTFIGRQVVSKMGQVIQIQLMSSIFKKKKTEHCFTESLHFSHKCILYFKLFGNNWNTTIYNYYLFVIRLLATFLLYRNLRT